MNSSPPHRVSKGLLLGLFVAISIGLVVGGELLFRQEVGEIRSQREVELKSIGSLKVGQIIAWRKERLADARIESSGILRTDVARWLQTPEDQLMKAQLMAYWAQVREAKGYRSIVLCTPDGAMLLGVGGMEERLSTETRTLVDEAVRKRSPVFGDFYLCAGEHVHLDVAAPILGEEQEPIAVLILATDPVLDLYPLIQSWPVPSRTAETVFLRKDKDAVVYLNELRHSPAPPLTLKVPMSRSDMLAVQAVSGKHGASRGKDYRAVDVMADIHPVPETAWFLVVKVDTEEILAEARYRGVVILLLVALVIVVVGVIGVLLYSGGQNALYKGLYQAGEALRASDTRYRWLIENTTDFVSRFDMGGNVLYASDAARNLFGLSPEEMIGTNSLAYVHPEDKASVSAELARLKGPESPLASVEYRFVCKDGQYKWVEAVARCVRNEQTGQMEILGVVRDVSERKRADEALRESERRLIALMGNLPGMAYRCRNDQDYTMEFVSEGCAALTGYSPADLLHNRKVSYGQLIHPDDQGWIWETLQANLERRQPFQFNYRIIAASGEERWVWERGTGLFSESGEFLGLEGFIQDITERRRAEEALRESEVHFRTLADSGQALVWTCSPDMRFDYVNRPYLEFTGRPIDQELGEGWMQCCHPDDLARYSEAARGYLERRERFSIVYRLRRHDGEYRWVRNNASPRYDSQGNYLGYIGHILDITEFEQAEQALRRNESILRAAIENIPFEFWVRDQDGCMIMENEALVRHWGSLLGTCPEESLITSEELARWQDNNARAFAGETLDEELTYDQDGEPRLFRSLVVPIRMGDEVRYILGMNIDITERRKQEAALRESEDRFRSLFENSSAVMLLIDSETLQIVNANKLASQFYGHSLDQLRSMLISDINILPIADLRVVMARAASKKQLQMRFRHRLANGELRDVEVFTNPIQMQGRVLMHSIIHDITERLRAEQSMVTQARQQEAVADLGQKAIAGTDLDEFRNEAVRVVAETFGIELCKILELLPGENAMLMVAGVGWHDGLVGQAKVGADITSQAGYTLHAPGPVIVEDLNTETRFSGPRLLHDHSVVSGISVIIPGEKGPWGVLGAHSRSHRVFSRDDINFIQNVANVIAEATHRKMVEDRLRHDAFHDNLTGLANRALLSDRIGVAFNRFKRFTDETFALIMMDLDRFKNVNDTLGHQIGDKVLCETARRLRKVARNSDTVARLGGDEFAVLLEDIHAEESSIRVARRLLEAMDTPFEIDGNVINLDASLGIVVATPSHMTTQEILRDADIALYRAKTSGRGSYQVFDVDMHGRIRERMELEMELRSAIERQEMALYLQPIVSLASGEICSFEALLRWKHPVRGFVPPDVFIPIAEETGLILSIGEWVTREACRIIRHWPEGARPVLSINASASEVLPVLLSSAVAAGRKASVEAIDERIARIAQEEGIDPSLLKLEITESVMISDPQHVGEVLARLVAKGFGLMLDDFGTGYSSLVYLQDLPVNQVKLDRAFTAKLETDQASRDLMQGIITLAHHIGLEVVAEGVETKEQLEILRGATCDFVQGYLIARPLPVEQAGQLYDSKQRW